MHLIDLVAAYDAALDAEGRAAFLWGLADDAAEQLARALTRRHLGRPLDRGPVEPTCADLGLPSLLPIDEEAAARVVAAVCERARADAQTGMPGAGEWLADLQSCRPRSVRLLATDDPRPLPGRWGRRSALVAAD